MRKYKFRGRDEHGVWHYGYLANIRLQSVPRWDSPTVIRFAEIVDEDDLTNRVDPDTVGQFTGLVDCEGREIYEGDVVRHENCICLVVYNSTRFASFALRKDGWAFDHYFGDAFEASECQVIGNVYDNSKLLKEGGGDA